MAKATSKSAADKAKAAKATAAKASAAAKAAAKAGDAPTTIKVPAISVESTQEGFRRGGRAWSKKATTVKLSDLTDEQIEQIENEDMLTVEHVEVDEEIVADAAE